jgi:lysozyme family protein
LPGPLAMVMFDSAVNQGVRRAARLLQKSLRVKVDGQIGPKTLGAARRADLAGIVDEFTTRRARHYASLKTFSTFGLGWTRRLTAVHRLAVRTRN